MKTENLPSKHITTVGVCGTVTIVLLIISFIWLFYNMYAYHEIRVKAPVLEPIGDVIYIGWLPKILLLISFACLFLLSLYRSINFKLSGILATIFGVLSFIWLFLEFAALQDISHEYLTGKFMCELEWNILYSGLFINLIFYMVGFITIIMIRREVKKSD